MADTEYDRPNPWVYKGQIFQGTDLEMFWGFLYEVEHLPTGRCYYGKRALWVCGDVTRPTNWMDYMGSSKHLSKEVALHGYAAYGRTILDFHTGPRTLAAAETALIHRKAQELGLAGIYNKAVQVGGRTTLLSRIYHPDGSKIKGRRRRRKRQ